MKKPNEKKELDVHAGYKLLSENWPNPVEGLFFRQNRNLPWVNFNLYGIKLCEESPFDTEVGSFKYCGQDEPCSIATDRKCDAKSPVKDSSSTEPPDYYRMIQRQLSQGSAWEKYLAKEFFNAGESRCKWEMKHKIESLPKWSQKIIYDKSEENKRLKIEISNLRKVTRQLDNGNSNWFTLFHPDLAKREGATHLFILQENAAKSVCVLGERDFVMVCRDPTNH